MIPKVIHYCWFGGNPLPELALKCIESWKKYCSGYEIIRWDETNYDLTNKSSYVREAYEAKKWAFVSDYARLDIIYQNGGIYLDIDVELIKGLDDFLNEHCFLGLQVGGYIATGLGFGAEQHSLAVKMMLDEYEGVRFKLGHEIYDMTPCPKRNTAPFKKIGFEGIDELCRLPLCTIYPTEYFCPMNYRTNQFVRTDNTVSIHHFSGTWIDKDAKLLRAEVAEYKKTHGKLATFCYKFKREYEIQYPDKGWRNTLRFAVSKIRNKIAKMRMT